MYLMHLRISEGTSDATSEGTSEETLIILKMYPDTVSIF